MCVVRIIAEQPRGQLRLLLNQLKGGGREGKGGVGGGMTEDEESNPNVWVAVRAP